MRPDEAFRWLDAHVNLEALGLPVGTTRRSHPTLDRMRPLAELLGSPQVEYPVVHVTGTNGKTSTARIASALLDRLGLAVGTYTSPHLERVDERIVRSGEPVDADTFAELLGLVADIEPFLPGTPSYFEILTGVALRWFADIAVDAAVVEVGLGGEWDATNVCDAPVAVVTNVSLDHVQYLGDTRAAIAREKAGIVKGGCETLVLGETDPALRPVFLERGAPHVVTRDVDFGVAASRAAHGGRVVDLYTASCRYDGVFLALLGTHQADNAATALAAVEALIGRPLDVDVVAEAFAAVASPGRLEVVSRRPLVVLDGAHNVAGAQTLARALADDLPGGPRTLVVGLLAEKDPAEMLAALDVASAKAVVCCRAPSPRAHDPEVIASAARALGVPRVEVVSDVPDAITVARDLTTPDGQIVVTGSLYVVGAARATIVPRPGVTPVRPTSVPPTADGSTASGNG